MATIALAPPPARLRPLPADRLCLAALMIAAVLIRWPSFGNPTYKLDEQFYLLVGDRLLHGALPYVDIWDRKPIGLFLIYAGIRALGGAGFVQYQLVATLFAGATAGCIFGLARPAAGIAGGVAGGLLYLLWIEVVEGGGGQAPVFYNLPMALAALLTMAALRDPAGPPFPRRAFGAMALVGLAIQIKYTALFEGLFFGLVLGWQILRRSTRPIAALAEVALLAATALAPTLLAFGCYAAIGQGRAFWFANFVSIFLRGGTSAGDLAFRLRACLLLLLPLIACALLGAWHQRRDPAGPRLWQPFMLGWLVAAAIGFLSVGVFYSHYLLPVFVPLCTAASPCLRRRPTGAILAAMALALPAATLHYPFVRETQDSRRQLDALAALVPAGARTGCMQMFAGPPSLYLVTGACTRTRFAFPDHLLLGMERDAIGVDQQAALAGLLAARPQVIVTTRPSLDPPRPNPASIAQIGRALTAGYRRGGAVPVDGSTIEVWIRR